MAFVWAFCCKREAGTYICWRKLSSSAIACLQMLQGHNAHKEFAQDDLLSETGLQTQLHS